MARSRKVRKQRVTLRYKRKEQLKHSVRAILTRSLVVLLVVGVGAGLVTGGDSFLPGFMRRHIPQIEVVSTSALAGLPVLAMLPRNPFWLWLPGSGALLQKRVCHKYPSVRTVRLERNYLANRVGVHLEPRIPLVSWNGSGFGIDGILFAMTPGAWPQLPSAHFLEGTRKDELRRWLAVLSSTPEVWPQVNAIRQTSSQMMELTLKTGTVVIWGSMEAESISRKAQILSRVLDDAHRNMGGAATADLRFFEQGRIIVLPKGK